jgi:predicted nucleotidyltransferase
MRPAEEYIKGWRARAQRLLETRGARAREARRLLPRLVRRLVEGYGARRVWLIGSLVEGGFHERSDIDLVVEGIEGAAIYRAGAELDEMAAGLCGVDLVPAEDAYPDVLEKARSRGQLLHER